VATPGLPAPRPAVPGPLRRQSSISVAGKTGTVNATDPIHGTQLTTNADLWFAGVTPDLAATTALFNLDNPSKAISGIPGMTDDQAGHLDGEFAAQVWVTAMTQPISGQAMACRIRIRSPTAPPIRRWWEPFDAAKQMLTDAGFKGREISRGTDS